MKSLEFCKKLLQKAMSPLHGDTFGQSSDEIYSYFYLQEKRRN
jgi:hypothetical protein